MIAKCMGATGKHFNIHNPRYYFHFYSYIIEIFDSCFFREDFDLGNNNK